MYATIDEEEPLDSTMGAMLIGALVSAVLYGVMTMQTYRYFTLYLKDALHLKVLVVVLVTLESVQLFCMSHIIYFHLITTYYDVAALQHVTWSVPIQLFCTNLISNLVQSCYALRVWRLGKSKLLLWSTFTLILAQCLCGLAWVSLTLRMKTYAQVISISQLTITIHTSSATIDTVVSLALITLLRRYQTGLIRSDSLISKMIHFIASTGLLTSSCAIASLFGMVAYPTTRIYVAFYFCLGRLYTNSLFAVLNSRRMLSRNEAGGTVCPEFTSVQYDITTISTCIDAGTPAISL